MIKKSVQALQNELQEVQSQIAALEASTDAQPNYGLGQGDPAVTRREVDRALLERLTKKEKTLEKALTAVNQGTYGICEVCGQAINPERMAILPDTKICVRCARGS